MKGTDGILALLQDIKEILYGIAWLIFGGILSIVGIITFQETDLGGILILIGAAICIGGTLYVRHGFGHHEVLEQNDP